MSHSASPVLGPGGTRPTGDGAENDSADDGRGDVDGLGYERRYVAMLYDRLDERRADTARRLQSVLHDETVVGGTVLRAVPGGPGASGAEHW